MAYGTELVLVLTREQILRYIDPTYSVEEIEDVKTRDDSELADYLSSTLDSRLAGVHEALVLEHLDPSAKRTRDGYMRLKRDRLTGRPAVELSPFRLEGLGDEAGEITFGVSLVSRYFPTWVDWTNPHGGSGEPIVLDEETMGMVKIARDGISEVIPEIATAALALVSCHY